jgi:hypothetical protein
MVAWGSSGASSRSVCKVRQCVTRPFMSQAEHQASGAVRPRDIPRLAPHLLPTCCCYQDLAKLLEQAAARQLAPSQQTSTAPGQHPRALPRHAGAPARCCMSAAAPRPLLLHHHHFHACCIPLQAPPTAAAQAAARTSCCCLLLPIQSLLLQLSLLLLHACCLAVGAHNLCGGDLQHIAGLAGHGALDNDGLALQIHLQDLQARWGRAPVSSVAGCSMVRHLQVLMRRIS